jgi:hypothetical protein
VDSLLLLGQSGRLVHTREFQIGCAQAYFFAFWAVYMASAVLIYFICMEVFRSALAAMPGLQKLGVVIFRWAVLVSCHCDGLLGFICAPRRFDHSDISIPLMRSVSLLELCLLGFLCLSMNALRLSCATWHSASRWGLA